jgi:hypothetical protein
VLYTCSYPYLTGGRELGPPSLVDSFATAIFVFSTINNGATRHLQPCRRFSEVLEAGSLPLRAHRRQARLSDNHYSATQPTTHRQAQHRAYLATWAEAIQAQRRAHRSQQAQEAWGAACLEAPLEARNLRRRLPFLRWAHRRHRNRKHKRAVSPAACSPNPRRRSNRP